MKRVITTVILLMLMGAAGFAQTSKRIYTTDEKVAEEQARIKADPELAAKAKADAKALKAIRKKIQAAIDSVAAAKAVNALDSLNFVMEVDRLADKYGNLAFVTSTTNFIKLHDSECTVQIAPFNGGGPNGVGGITLDGRASNINMQTDKRGNITYSMMVQGAAISAMVTISLNKGSNEASATVTPNFNSNSITMTGQILPPKESRIFKGNAF